MLLGLRNHPKHPFVAVLGGAKISDKLGVVEALLDVVDSLVIGGAMCFTFLAAQGNPIGDSLFEPDQVDTCRRLLATPARGQDDPPARGHRRRRRRRRVRHLRSRLPDGAKGFDIGPGSAAAFSDIDHGRPHGVLERPDGHVRGRPLRRRNPHGRPGDGRHQGVHRRRRRRLRRGARPVPSSTTRSTTCPPAAARRSNCSSSATCRASRHCDGEEPNGAPTAHLRQLEDEPQPLRGDPDRPEAGLPAHQGRLRGGRRQRASAVHRHPLRADGDRDRGLSFPSAPSTVTGRTRAPSPARCRRRSSPSSACST